MELISTDPVERLMGFAPPEPPDWFEPVMATPRPTAPIAPDSIAKLVQSRAEPEKAANAELAVALSAFYLLEKERHDAGRAWDAHKKQERLLQWPAWWAEEVLRRRKAMSKEA